MRTGAYLLQKGAAGAAPFDSSSFHRIDSPHTDEKTDPSASDLLLDDPHWVSLIAEHKRLAERLSSGALAAADLTKAMADGIVRTMWRRIADGVRERPPPDLWAHYQLSYWSDGLLIIRRPKPGWSIVTRLRGWVPFVWKPDVDKFWLRYELPPVTDQKLETNATAVDPPVSSTPELHPTPVKRHSTKESLYEAALRKHSPKGKRKSEWADEMAERSDGWGARSIQNWLARPEINELWLSRGGLPTSPKMRGGRRRG